MPLHTLAVAPLVLASLALGQSTRELAFQPNLGQAPQPCEFVARGSEYALTLARDRAVLGVSSGECGERSIAMELVGVRDGARGVPGDARVERFAYFQGRDPARWLRDVPSFDSVRYDGVWPGIDVVYLGVEGRFRYDFHVAPHADPRAIRLRFDGVEQLELLPDGALALDTPFGRVVQPPPILYQICGGERESVRGGFELAGDGTLAFALDAWDPERELVIDPTVVWQSLIGTSGHETAIAGRRAPGGNLWLVGLTDDSGFPRAGAGNSFVFQGGVDVFVSEFDPSGALLFSAMVGGSNNDLAHDAQLVGDGDIVVCGETMSPDFPAQTNGATPAFQAQLFGGLDAFVFRLTDAGTLEFSTYLGGGGSEYASSVGVVAGNDVVVAGRTDSVDFPVQNAAQPAIGGGDEGFVARIAAAGDALVWSTFWGTAGDEHFDALAIDPSDDSIVAAGTVLASGSFAQRFLADGTPAEGLAFGNPGFESIVHAVAIAANGTVALGIGTYDPGLATVDAFAGGDQGSGQIDGFVGVWDASLGSLEFATYFGGTGLDECVDLVARDGRIFALVSTTSQSLPQVETMVDNSVTYNGAYLASIDLGVSPPALEWASYLPSVSPSQPCSLAADPTAGGPLFAAGTYAPLTSTFDSFPAASFGTPTDASPNASLMRIEPGTSFGTSVVGFGPPPTVPPSSTHAVFTVYRWGSTAQSIDFDYHADSTGQAVPGLDGQLHFDAGEQVLQFAVDWNSVSVPTMYLTLTLEPGDGVDVDPERDAATVMVTPHTVNSGHRKSHQRSCCTVAAIADTPSMREDLELMREFRDRVLSRFGAGREFIRWYYRDLSPAAVRFLGEHPAAMPVARAMLAIVLFVLRYPVQLAGVVLALAMVRHRARNSRRREAYVLAR